MAVVRQIRSFEAEQQSAMAALVEKPCDVLRMTQALLLNGATAAVPNARGKDHETPLFFFMHTGAAGDQPSIASLGLLGPNPPAGATRARHERVGLFQHHGP
jgi:hypothetical protein